MSKKQSRESATRQAARSKRAQEQRRQRIIVVSLIAIVAVLLIVVLAYPSIKAATTPVGEIVKITPVTRPQAKDTGTGDPNAPVRVDVFSDFQCPACKQFADVVEQQIIKAYVEPGKVYLVYRHFPFIDDRAAAKESDQAANASMCAAAQGRFWDYHDMLFSNWQSENQGAFADKRLVAFAQALGLDMNQFNACFKANTYKDKIDADLKDGQTLNVTGTPSVFVNRKIVKPGFIPNFEDMRQAIDAALAGQ